jgi:hypothetical protein
MYGPASLDVGPLRVPTARPAGSMIPIATTFRDDLNGYRGFTDRD